MPYDNVTGGVRVAAAAKAQPVADASVEKKIDELTAQIKELRQAIEALAKSQAKK